MRDERLPRAYGMVPVRLLLQRRFKEPSSLGIVHDNLLKLKPMVLRRKVRKITKSSSFNGNKKYAPEPPGAWPIIGHLPLLVSAKQPHRAFAALADKYGPAFMLRMGMTSPMLIVSSREVAKECYTCQRSCVCN
ncbi:hypothetical protein Syun_030982 [Stephania yunnanensis]|uniref:Cytochrome P450 n=1 Tax=Stephania yunnanensis TaxID=152371 RepID=A0AAP0DVR2_9MAGN